MGTIITIIAVVIGVYLVFLAGIYFGQGMMTAALRDSDDEDFEYVGAEFYECVTDVRDWDGCPWILKLVYSIVLLGVKYQEKLGPWMEEQLL